MWLYVGLYGVSISYLYGLSMLYICFILSISYIVLMIYLSIALSSRRPENASSCDYFLKVEIYNETAMQEPIFPIYPYAKTVACFHHTVFSHAHTF